MSQKHFLILIVFPAALFDTPFSRNKGLLKSKKYEEEPRWQTAGTHDYHHGCGLNTASPPYVLSLWGQYSSTPSFLSFPGHCRFLSCLVILWSKIRFFSFCLVISYSIQLLLHLSRNSLVNTASSPSAISSPGPHPHSSGYKLTWLPTAIQPQRVQGQTPLKSADVWQRLVILLYLLIRVHICFQRP